MRIQRRTQPSGGQIEDKANEAAEQHAHLQPAVPLSPSSVLQMQRLIGNRATQAYIQRKSSPASGTIQRRPATPVERWLLARNHMESLINQVFNAQKIHAEQQALHYEAALKEQDKILKAAAYNEKLADDVLWALLFAGIGGFIGSAVGTGLKGLTSQGGKMENYFSSEFWKNQFNDNVKKYGELIPVTAIKTGVAASQGGSVYSKSGAVSVSTFKSKANLELEEAKRPLLSLLTAIDGHLNTHSNDPNLSQMVDTFHRTLPLLLNSVLKGPFFDGTAVLTPSATTQQEYELSLWEAWMEQFGHSAYTFYNYHPYGGGRRGPYYETSNRVWGWFKGNLVKRYGNEAVTKWIAKSKDAAETRGKQMVEKEKRKR